ncbi:MAG: ankyrin repeat domain-containing protein, partial [Bryobacteraceae bacterium]
MKTILSGLVALSSMVLPIVASPSDAADRIYLSIRNNDLAGLRAQVKTSGVDIREKRGATPLMLAAAYGSVDAMKLLIDAGADVNAKNDFEATALLWSASDIDKVR